MLVSREELRFDFGPAAFNLADAAERRLLGWVFNQFLYGEVTGIQCGHWLYRAPHLNAATFLARQAGEELSHVRKILRIFTLLGEAPAAAHPAIRFLSTGMMGGTWGEHVALEMAIGEGLVLGVFYAMADTIPDPEIKKILESAVLEEERHVEFGERETQTWLVEYPGSRKLLLGSALLQLSALGWLRNFIIRQLLRGHPGHPVLIRFDAFYRHSLTMLALRIERLGLSPVPLSQLGGFARFSLILALPLRKIMGKFRYREKKLTSTYLQDPVLQEEARRAAPLEVARK